MDARSAIYVRLIADLGEHRPFIRSLPNVLGPAYGAGMCDRCLRLSWAYDRVIDRLDGALPVELYGRSLHAPLHLPPQGARNMVRAATGLPFLSSHDARRYYRTKNARYPPLEIAEKDWIDTRLELAGTRLFEAEKAVMTAGRLRKSVQEAIYDAHGRLQRFQNVWRGQIETIERKRAMSRSSYRPPPDETILTVE